MGAVNAGGAALSDPVGSGAFMVSMEYQLAYGDVGSLYNLGPIAFSTSSHETSNDLLGAWNQVEIVHRDGMASSWLNGREVSSVVGFQLALSAGITTELRCGKLQLQSEGAEIFFRRSLSRLCHDGEICAVPHFRC